MPGRTKQNKEPPHHNRRGVHALQVNTLTTEYPKDKKLTIYLVDVASADHHHRTFPRGPKRNLQRKAQQNFQQVFSKEAYTAVILSCQGKRLKVGKETGKGWGQERGRMVVWQAAVLNPAETS
jgi:hypothetical protein